MINVLIAAGHSVVRPGIRQVVSSTTAIAVVDEVERGRLSEFCRHVNQISPDTRNLSGATPFAALPG